MTACIPWTKSLNKPGGYGTRSVKGQRWQAHRYAYFQKHGPIPEGLEVCHSCNVKLCVNVDHLYLASHQKNMQDAAKDGLLINQNKRKKCCPVCGSEYGGPIGDRECRPCRNLSQNAWRKRRREKVPAIPAITFISGAAAVARKE